jgi:hypothetical protein
MQAFVLSLHPTHFFFQFLLYTDIPSLLCVLLAIYVRPLVLCPPAAVLMSAVQTSPCRVGAVACWGFTLPPEVGTHVRSLLIFQMAATSLQPLEQDSRGHQPNQ